MSGFIYNRNGELVEITDFNEAYQDAKNAVEFHKGKEGIKYTDAQKEWEHILFELEKIKLKNQ